MRSDNDMEENTNALNEVVASVEALLFIHGEPLTMAKMSKMLEIEASVLNPAIKALEERLAADDRGLALISSGDKVQLVTKPRFNEMLRKFVKDELSEALTPASLETLSIISYLGPISKSRLEYLRGVNSSFILRNLMLRGLLERVPDPNQANAFLYQASFDLIKHLGIARREDLPEFEKFTSLLSNLESVIQKGEE